MLDEVSSKADFQVVFREGAGDNIGFEIERYDKGKDGFIKGALVTVYAKSKSHPNVVPPIEFNELEIKATVMHETGHALGLKHRSISGKVMSPEFNDNINIDACEIDAVRTANHWYFDHPDVLHPPHVDHVDC